MVAMHSLSRDSVGVKHNPVRVAFS
jgi:hypothetical protein